MTTLTVLGIDAAFSNMGLARMSVESRGGHIIDVESLCLVCTEGQHKKEVRKSSDDLRRARELHDALIRECGGTFLAMAEVPSGSQSSRASWSLGIAVGILAGCPVPVIQVSQLEVKLASVGKKTASKDEMIEWARSLYPHANWLTHRGKLTKSNEHLADAIATVHAGVRTETFKLLCSAQPHKPSRVKLL